MMSPDLLYTDIYMRTYPKIERYSPAYRYLHRVIFCLDKQSSLRECLDDFIPSMESFHALSTHVRQLRILGTGHQTCVELISGIRVQRPVVVENADEV